MKERNKVEISYVIRAQVLGLSVQQLSVYDQLLEKGVSREDALAAIKGQPTSSESELIGARAT